MTHSPLTNAIRLAATKHSSREGARIDTFLIHHAAMLSQSGESLVGVLTGPKQVSANYALGSDGTLWCVVDEDRRAWTSGSTSDGGKGAAWDRRSITIEIANESGAPDWRISDAAIDKAARLLIDLRQRYGITNVLGHRDLYSQYGASYATFCPGPETVNRILAREAEINGGAPVADDKEMVRRIATYLNGQVLGMSSTAASDGIRGKVYWTMVQTWGSRNGLYPQPAYKIDGEPGGQSRVIERRLDEITRPAPAPAPTPEPTPEPVPEPTPQPTPGIDSEALAEMVAQRVVAALPEFKCNCAAISDVQVAKAILAEIKAAL